VIYALPSTLGDIIPDRRKKKRKKGEMEKREIKKKATRN